MNTRQTKRNAFMLCAVHRAVNSALMDYKARMCFEADGTIKQGVSFVNYNRTLNVLGTR